jgi:hypothetical protein
MFFVGTFGVGVLRARMPKLALLSNFSALVEVDDDGSGTNPQPTPRSALARYTMCVICFPTFLSNVELPHDHELIHKEKACSI